MYNILSTYAKPMEEDMSLSLKVDKKIEKTHPLRHARVYCMYRISCII